MKKVKKTKITGFTLIELIAVILVLSLIALIGVPLIGNIIEDAKKNSFKTSIQNLVTAANDKCNVEKLNGKELTNKYTFTESGSTPSIEVKGKLPTEGTLTLDNECNVSLNVSNNDYTATLNGEVVIITEKTAKKYEDYTTGKNNQVEVIYFNPKDNKMCTNYTASNSAIGFKDGCMKWYVIKDSDSNNDKVEVILDHNTSETVSYDDYATSLAADTTGWNSSLNARLIDPDYIAAITGAASTTTLNWLKSKDTSLPFLLDGGSNIDKTSYDNVDGWLKINATTKGASNYAWLFDYTSSCEEHGCNHNETTSSVGYWTNSLSVRDTTSAWNISNEGVLGTEMTDCDWSYGIRPVITITKQKLS